MQLFGDGHKSTSQIQMVVMLLIWRRKVQAMEESNAREESILYSGVNPGIP
jgi:hypothetical protein